MPEHSLLTRTRIRDERGWVIVVAMFVLFLMLGIGLALAKVVDTQSSASGSERVRESSFNLAEGLLNAENAILQANWPTRAPCSAATLSSGCAFTPDCTNANAGSRQTPPQCPSPTLVVGAGGAFDNNDVNKLRATWTISIRDDVGGAGAATNPLYVKSQVDVTTCTDENGVTSPSRDANNNPVPCAWDANGNRRLWIRADATVGGVHRAVIGLFELQDFELPLARNVLVSGGTDFGNNGNKVLVDTGAGTSASQIVLHCAPNPYGTLAPLVDGGTTGMLVGGVAARLNVTSGTVSAGQKLAIGIGTANYELLTVTAVAGGTPTVVTLGAPGATHPHNPGEQWALAPNPDPAVNNCMTWDPSKTQVSPPGNYVLQPGSNPAPALDPNDLNSLISGPLDNHVTGGCPANNVASWSGRVVIENPPANVTCAMPGHQINSPTNPGFVVVKGEGSSQPVLNIGFGGGNTYYYGIIYVAAPSPDAATPRVAFKGNPTIQGGLIIDGLGTVQIGQASGNQPSIIYDPNAFLSFTAAGATGLIQNSWRELSPRDM
jgi:Tfp pilus assembly protein PilX